MRCLVAALAVVLTALSFSAPADAKLRVVEHEVKWLNTNRLACAGVDRCVPIDTLYASIANSNATTPADTRVCSTMVVSLKDAVLMHAGALGDSGRAVFARLILVSDSTTAPTADSITVTLEGVVASSIAAEWESVQPGFNIMSRTFVPSTAGRVMTFPFVVSATAAYGHGKNNPLLWPSVRFIVENGAAAGLKHFARARAFVSYYIDE